MGFTDEELSVLCNNPQSDPRVFAMKHWKWKRVEGYNVETWSATKQDLKLIADGLYEIYPEVEDNPDMPFNIEVVGQNRAFYTRVPFWQIDEGKFSSMQRGDQYGLAFSKKRIIQSLKYSQILDNYGKYMESDYIISNL